MKKFIKKITPSFVKNLYRVTLRQIESYKEKKLISKQPHKYEKAIKKIRGKKGPIHIVFFAIYKSVWKYDSFYQLVKDDPRFKLTVLVCPAINRGREHMIESLNECYEDFQKRDYNVIKAYDENTGIFLNARDLKPDIIFYTNPYQGLIDDRYYITNFLDIPSVYINYGFSQENDVWVYALLFHKLLWRYYAESGTIREYIIKAQKKKFNNNIVTSGYPTYDDFINKEWNLNDWKIKDLKLKRIIWAPHHTIDLENPIQYSTFLKYAEFLRKISRQYRDRIQFVFKPHPLLKSKLYNHPDWGKKKTDEYYSWWEKESNTNYISGDYINLFLSSDALIHDCSGFSCEYLYLDKPPLFLSDFNHEEQLSELGKAAYQSHYKATNQQDIIDFIENVVIRGLDPMKDQRKKFFINELLPPDNKSVAEIIRDNILESIFKS